MKDYLLGFAVACVLFLGYEVYGTKRINTPPLADYTFGAGTWYDGAETDFSDFGHDLYVDMPDEIWT